MREVEELMPALWAFLDQMAGERPGIVAVLRDRLLLRTYALQDRLDYEAFCIARTSTVESPYGRD